ncbi:hypothetical protein D1007_13106 [Hordeum vulgare]|nr:hypothetical protein D1007_13106 [Hordeum vulgare]
MVSSGRTAVNINGEIGPYFPIMCGVRQGDPFSPFLFNMVVDALASILDKAKEANHIHGIIPHLCGHGLGLSPAVAQSIIDLLNCELGSFPLAYLGIPISDSRLSVAELRPMVAKLEHHIEPWQGRRLSKAARTVLVNSSLSILLLFRMSFYSLPETLHHEIATVQALFF